MQQQTSLIMSIFLAFSVFFLTACVQIPDKPDFRFPTTSTDDNVQQLKTSSELTAFLKQHQQTSGYGGGFRGTLESAGPQSTALAKASEGGARSGDGSPRYSQTNVQVEGVDEADIVKNDGKYIYTLTQNKLAIVDAYPPNTAKITATLSFAGTPRQLFVNKDRLLVFTDIQQEYPVYIKEILPSAGIAERSIYPPIRYAPPKTGVYLYDTSNKAEPKLVMYYTIEGYYYQSRMIGDYGYVVAQHPSYSYGGDPVPLPAIESNKEIVATSPVYYFDNYEPSLNFNSIASFNLFDPDDVQLRSYLLGYANTLYVSQHAIYLAYQKQVPYRYYEQQAFDLWKNAVMPSVSSDVRSAMQKILDSDMENYLKQQRLTEALENYFNSLAGSESARVRKQLEEKMTAWSQQQQEEQMKTIIHKLTLNKGDVRYVTKGEVKGTLLNQFSLDEYADHLRVATTMDLYGRDHAQYNNVYVLDEDLDVVGSLEKLAPNERIYSARFMGKKGYLVTFKKVDPLFVIDLSNPTKPAVLGKLKIPGYSDYLHPYDENHIIGVGKDTAEAEDTLKQQRQLDFAWYQGVKMALFDVSDVNNPKELHKVLIGDRGTESDALHDHKAFLFDKEKNLLVLPITLAEIKGERREPTQYGEYTFQGVYVYRLTLDKGFVLQGRISHYYDDAAFRRSGYYFWGDSNIQRSLYIGDILYTVSQKKIKAHDLDDLQIEHKTITLPYQENVYNPPIYY